jgi:WD40 repeat protein
MVLSTFDAFEDVRTPNKSKQSEDRFIPQRNTPASNDIFMLSKKEGSPSDISNFSEVEKDKLLYSNLLDQKMLNFEKFCQEGNIKGLQSTEKAFKCSRPKVLQFSQKKENSSSMLPSSFVMDEQNVVENDLIRSIKYSRRIPKAPIKILDAPGVVDDFYQDILDWSQKDVIAIALAGNIYLFKNKVKDNSVSKLAELVDTKYSTVKFSPSGNYLALGEESGNLFFYDAVKETNILQIKPHLNRICSMSWMNENIISTGSRDATIKNFDIRTKSCIASLEKHSQEVCGLRWSPEENYLASGGNENHIYIWDIRK